MVPSPLNNNIYQYKGPRTKCTENGLMIKNAKEFFSCIFEPAN